MGTLNPVSGTDPPMQAQQSGGVLAVTNNVPDFLGPELKKQRAQAVTEEALGREMTK